MAKTEPFDKNYRRYDRWFEKNEALYESEIAAVKELLSGQGYGIEIGVGTGRFAKPLGIRVGVEPSIRMGQIARSRGIDVVGGVAEALPFGDCSFDFALMVTTVCFVDDADRAFREVHRVLKPDGCFLNGLIDAESSLGRLYAQKRALNPFYAQATFYSVRNMFSKLEKAGFGDFTCRQTVFRPLQDMNKIQIAKTGYGEGSFVVIRALKQTNGTIRTRHKF